MSPPAPFTVKTPLLDDDEPAMPTDPTSWFNHGLGRPAAAAVVYDQTGPDVVPLLLCATICQKYCVPAAVVDGVYEPDACPVVTCGGGFAVPNFTS
jgi:hypothetical protein